MTDQPVEPGGQIPGETSRAYAAFRIYLELGPTRSTGKVGERLGHRSSKQAETWCSRWRWRERVQEYERHAVARVDEHHLSEIERRARRQAETAQLHIEATTIVGRELLTRLRENRLDVSRLSAEQLLQLEATLARAHARAVQTERLALGMSTDNRGDAGEVTPLEQRVARMDDDEITGLLEDGGVGAGDLIDLASEREQRRAS